MSDVKLAILCEHGLFEPHWRSHDRPYRENDTCPGGHPVEGGEQIWLCSIHIASGPNERGCFFGAWHGLLDECRMVERFLIPPSNTETEK